MNALKTDPDERVRDEVTQALTILEARAAKQADSTVQPAKLWPDRARS